MQLPTVGFEPRSSHTAVRHVTARPAKCNTLCNTATQWCELSSLLVGHNGSIWISSFCEMSDCAMWLVNRSAACVDHIYFSGLWQIGWGVCRGQEEISLPYDTMWLILKTKSITFLIVILILYSYYIFELMLMINELLCCLLFPSSAHAVKRTYYTNNLIYAMLSRKIFTDIHIVCSYM